MPPVPPTQTSPYLLQLLGARAVASRYNVALRTLDRWLAREILPPPARVINNRRYWLLADLEAADRQHTLNAGALAAGE
jgi:DNA-binding transcriptional MerR regulator